MIAVLPFVNLSGEASQEYFSDGLTEDIMTELARFGICACSRATRHFNTRGRR